MMEMKVSFPGKHPYNADFIVVSSTKDRPQQYRRKSQQVNPQRFQQIFLVPLQS